MKPFGVECNVLNVDSIKMAHQVVCDTYGKCDVLINGAGGNNFPRQQRMMNFF